MADLTTPEPEANQCDHIVGVNYDPFGADLVNLKDPRWIDLFFNFCPKCGTRLQPQMPVNAPQSSAKAPLSASEGQDSGDGVKTAVGAFCHNQPDTTP